MQLPFRPSSMETATAGAPVTINFLPTATAVATTTVTSAVVGSGTLRATTVVDGVNNQSLAGQIQIVFTRNGQKERVAAANVSADSADVTYDDGLAALKNTQTVAAFGYPTASIDTLDAIDTAIYAAQAYLGTVKIGSVSNATSTTGVLNASVDGTDRVKATNNASVTWTAGATVAGNQANSSTTAVKTGYAGDIAFSAKLISADATEVALSGVTVKVTLTKSVLATASTFTAGGVTLSATSGDVVFYVKSDADGYIAFTGKGTGAVGDAVIVKIAALKSTGAYDTNVDQNTVTWADSALATPVLTNIVDSNNVKIVAGATFDVKLSVTDQFGAAPASGSYRYAITTANTTGAAFAYYPVVTAGLASQSIVDNSTATGTYTVTAQLQKLTGGAWANSGAAVTVDVYVSSKTAAAVSATVPTVEVATIAKTLVAADLRVNNNAQTASSIGYSGTTATVAGTVTDSLGATLAGQAVTIAGAGLGFISKDGNVYAIGSITVNTDDNGAYQVSVFSTASGKQAITVTAGAATAAKTIPFAGVISMSETNVLSLDVAALTQVGRAVTVTVKLVNKYGTAVDTAADAIAVSVTGVGSLSATKVETGAAGTATFQFVAGGNDFGDAVITAKYTAGDAAATVVSASKTVAVGITDAQVDVVGKRVTAVASFSKGKTVGFYVDGVKKWSKLSVSDADVVLNYNLKKGRHTVTVKISGGFITSEVIIVK